MPSSEQPLAFVVDDEPAMLDIVTFALETQGFAHRSFRNAEDAWVALHRERPDLLVLDVMLPGRSGVDLCRRVRDVSDVPVLLLTARGETADRLQGLEAGADDYVTKPFHPRELALRAQGLVRRAQGMRRETLEFGPVTVQPLSSTVHAGRQRVELTPTEYKVLLALITHPEEVLEFRRLLHLVWGDADRVGARELLKTAVYRVRLKLEAAEPGSGGVLHSVRGVGYQLSLGVDD